MDGGAWWAAVHGVAKSRTWLSDFTFTIHFHALEKEMATHSSVIVWRIPGMGEPDGLPSMGLHRVGHDWSDLAAAAAATELQKRRTWLKWLSTHDDFTWLCDFFFHCVMLCLVAQLCQTICDPLDYSPPGSSVHGIFQARILEWVAISYSRESSWPRYWTYGSYDSCIAGKLFTCWATGKLKEVHTGTLQEKFNFSCFVNR